MLHFSYLLSEISILLLPLKNSENAFQWTSLLCICEIFMLQMLPLT